MVDALAAYKLETIGMTRRELALASNIIDEGRALVVLLNKIDAIPKEFRQEVTHADALQEQSVSKLDASFSIASPLQACLTGKSKA